MILVRGWFKGYVNNIYIKCGKLPLLETGAAYAAKTFCLVVGLRLLLGYGGASPPKPLVFKETKGIPPRIFAEEKDNV